MGSCSLYWLHLKEHTDLLSEGYIGITSQGVAVRFKEHKKEARKGSDKTISKAIRKYGDNIIASEILIGSRDYCLLIESKLRPNKRIGWNIVEGGGAPPPFTKGHTEEAKRRIGEASKLLKDNPNFIASVERKKGVPRPLGVMSKAIAASAAARKDLPSWRQSKANKEIWALALDIYPYVINGMSKPSIAKLMGVPASSLVLLIDKINKQKWNPNDDSAFLIWLEQHKGNIKK